MLHSLINSINSTYTFESLCTCALCSLAVKLVCPYTYFLDALQVRLGDETVPTKLAECPHVELHNLASVG
jgi:hypothetical protein